MLIQVLHFDRENDMYEHVADVNVERRVVTDGLEYAYRYTQNLDGSWSMGEEVSVDGHIYDNPDYNENVTVMKPLRTWSDGRKMGHRSTSMYDRMIVDGVIYEIDAIGFRELENA